MALRRFFAALLCFMILFTAPGALAASSLALQGFYESAFRGEFGDTDRGRTVRWTKPIVICVAGAYTKEDIAAIGELIFSLAENVKNLPQMSVTTREKGANVILTYAPYDQMKEIVKQCEDGSDGFVWVNYTSYRITRAKIVISSEITDQEFRSGVAREEIVNMLGLLNDITCTTESIICQEGETVTDLSPLDYEMLNLLYDKRIPAGTTLSKAKKILGE
jgi:hypothetical protein